MNELKAYGIRVIDGLIVESESGQLYLKSEADKAIAEKDKVIAKLERQIEFLKVTHDACGNCNKCADGMGKVFDKYIKEHG